MSEKRLTKFQITNDEGTIININIDDPDVYECVEIFKTILKFLTFPNDLIEDVTLTEDELANARIDRE